MRKNVRRTGAVIAAALFSVVAVGGTAAQAADTSWSSTKGDTSWSSTKGDTSWSSTKGDTSWSSIKGDTSWSVVSRADTSW